MPNVRRAAVAGSFYPPYRDELLVAVWDLLEHAGGMADARAIITPHAGLMYSGPIAASAWNAMRARRGSLERVVLVGPAHGARVEGVATSTADAFATPLGDVRVDRSGVDEAEHLAGVVRSDAAHATEHSIEVELPFVVLGLGDAPIVPLVVGTADAAKVADVLDALAPDASTVIAVSSNLSRQLPYEEAKRRDAATTRAIETLDAGAIRDDDACGAVAIRALLTLASRRGWKAKTLDVRSSGDTAGSHDEVVGYGAWSFA